LIALAIVLGRVSRRGKGRPLKPSRLWIRPAILAPLPVLAGLSGEAILAPLEAFAGGPRRKKAESQAE
jgi:hypothetical protein